jgi:hypothetical protein
VKVVNYVNYIVNHNPTKAFKNITPEEAWSKIKPDVCHFFVFGSKARAHIPKRKGNHYDVKVRTAFLLDIPKMSKVMDFFNLTPMKLLL